MKILRKTSNKKRVKAKGDSNDPLKYDLSNVMLTAKWHRAKFEFSKPKKKVITLRVSEDLLNEVKKQAKTMGLGYQCLIRLTLENSLLKRTS